MFGVAFSADIPENQKNTYYIFSIIAMLGRFIMLPFSIWQGIEARNDLIESIYRYNYNCNCLLNTEQKICDGFYYPRKDFLNNLYFKNICDKINLSLDSKEADERFSVFF